MTNSGTLASIKKCREMVQKRTGCRARKSGAEYFLGNGTGLAAIVSRQEFPELEKKWRNTKTEFWRSNEVSEILARVRGQKASTGVITYRGIQLRFDDMLYPKESRDDLWFYVGFSVAGPYAYDPVDKDTYSIQRTMGVVPYLLLAEGERGENGLNERLAVGRREIWM